MRCNPEFSKSVRPIFIIGAPRSGTSITTWVLGQHPNIQPMPETSWIATLAAGSYLSYSYGSARGKYSHLSNVAFELTPFMRRIGEAVDSIVNDCFEERCQRIYLDSRGRGTVSDASGAGSQHGFEIRRSADEPKRRWVDGTPFNTAFVWGLCEMFPEAQFIHNLRRPGDVATSLEGFDKFGHASLELKEGLRTWKTHTEAAWLAELALGEGKVFRLDFERLTTDQETLIKNLCAFLGEEYSPACLVPLAQRINSSEVDSRREANLARLRKLRDYRDCETLYDKIACRPASVDCDSDALAALKDQFQQFCNSHPLL